MPTIAELLGQDAAERLAAARDEAGQLQAEETASPVPPACQSCGQRLPAPAAVFRAPEPEPMAKLNGG